MRSPAFLAALGATGTVLLLIALIGHIHTFTLTSVIINWLIVALIALGICAIIFSLISVFVVWGRRPREIPHSSHSNHLVAPWPFRVSTLPVFDVEYFESGSTLVHNEFPAYRTRVEILNKYLSLASPCQPTLFNVAAVSESFPNDYTFATSPFTSPPVFAMEIFVSKEEVIVHDETIAAPDTHEAPGLIDFSEELCGEDTTV